MKLGLYDNPFVPAISDFRNCYLITVFLQASFTDSVKKSGIIR